MKTKMSKRFKDIENLTKDITILTLEEAVDLLKKCPPVKFDETMEISMRLGVDPKKADQQVRGTVALPHGTGKKIKVLVLAKSDKEKEAKESGADYFGNDEIIEKIKGGWTDFDVMIATPDMMREVGKLGKILGPRGLMPTPKAGTVTTDITKATKEIKAGKIEFKIDKNCLLNNSVGKISFSKEMLVENIKKLVEAVIKAKPSAAKGVYIKSMHLATTMGPGLKIDVQAI